MSTKARSAWASLFQRQSAAGPPAVFATVEECINITGPSMKTKMIDVTNMDSPNAYMEYIVGLLDGGSVAVEGNWTAATEQMGVLADFQARILQNWQILLPGTQPAAGSWTFAGYIIDFSQDFKVQDKITYKFTVQISGPAVFANS